MNSIPTQRQSEAPIIAIEDNYLLRAMPALPEDHTARHNLISDLLEVALKRYGGKVVGITIDGRSNTLIFQYCDATYDR